MVALPDTTNIDPASRFEIIPRGLYPVEIVASEEKATQDGKGSYIELEMSILDGPYMNHKLWDRLNLNNPNQKAVEIAQRTLAQICHAVSKIGVTQSEELHHRAMLADVRVRPARTDPKTGKQYDESNEIKGYKPINAQAGAAPAFKAQPSAAPATATTQASAAGNVPPWRRGK